MRKKLASVSKWYELALEELEDHERIEITLVGEERGASGASYYKMKSVGGRGRSGESQWIVFKKEADAEKQAVAIVKERLLKSPQSFSKAWLQQFVSFDPATAREIAVDTAEKYVDLLDDAKVLFIADLKEDWDILQESIDEIELDILSLQDNEDEDESADAEKQLKKLHADVKGLRKQQEKLLLEARKEALDSMAEETLDKLQNPVEYLKEIDLDVFRDKLPSWITLDIEQAALEAVNKDGIAHFLDTSNSAGIQLEHGIAYGRS